MRRKLTYDPARDYYRVLGVGLAATESDIRRAYRERVRTVHPDRNPDRREWATEQIKLLNEAYTVLRDTHQRREYNRLRWPHTVHERVYDRPPNRWRTAYTSQEPARPWWEQAAADVSAGAAEHASASRRPTAPTGAPALSRWLRARGLGRLEPVLLTLIGLWRSPYAGLLAVLSVVLALNVGVIVYFLLAPGEEGGWLDDLQTWLAGDDAVSVAVSATPTPDRIHRVCPPGAQIAAPADYSQVGDTLHVIGTVDDAQLWNYEIALGYLGDRRPQIDSVPSAWEVVRAPPDAQSTRESVVIDGPLTGAIDLAGYAPGYYALRLRVNVNDAIPALVCDVIFRH